MMLDRVKTNRSYNLKKLLTLFLAVFPVNGVFDVLFFDHRCLPNNCTQGKRFETDHIFPCTIGGQKDVDDFNKSVMNLDTRSLTDGAVVLLRSVDWYLTYAFTDNATGKKCFNPSLSITFQLPRQSNDVRAILMKFSSPADPEVADSFYSLPNNSRVRLFDFRNYMPLEYDLEHPRSVSYNCVVGLDHLHNNRVYTLALRALPFGEQVEYSIITNSRDQYVANFTGNINPPSWRSTVAVAILTKQQKLHVVFEPAPIKFLVTEYNVQLIWQEDQNSSSQILASKTILQDSEMYSCLFPITVAGTYFAKVLAKGENCHGSCSEALSYNVSLNLKETVTENREDNIKQYLMIGGSLLGILLLALMAVVLRQGYSQYSSIKEDENHGKEENTDSVQSASPSACTSRTSFENGELQKSPYDQTTDKQIKCSFKCVKSNRKADKNVKSECVIHSDTKVDENEACYNGDMESYHSDNCSLVLENRQTQFENCEIPIHIKNSRCSKQIQNSNAESDHYSNSMRTSPNACNCGMETSDHNSDYSHMGSEQTFSDSGLGSNSCDHQTKISFHKPLTKYTYQQVNSDDKTDENSYYCNCEYQTCKDRFNVKVYLDDSSYFREPDLEYPQTHRFIHNSDQLATRNTQQKLPVAYFQRHDNYCCPCQIQHIPKIAYSDSHHLLHNTTEYLGNRYL